MTDRDATDDTTAYLRNQGHALHDLVRQAVTDGGDLTEILRVLDHVVAEGPDGMTRGFLLAPVLFSLGLEAQQQGDLDLADMYDALSVEWCEPEAINVAIVSGFVVLGRKQGWLPADVHDRAAAAAATLPEHHALAGMLAMIERRSL
ncbi:hypothetical protein ACVDFE_00240 [Lentzea chajnantorensis]